MTAPDWFNQYLATPTCSHNLSVQGTRIAYRAWNHSEQHKPGLLFVHGYGAHSHWWDFIAPAFTAEYQVAAMDMSGAGDSDHRDQYSAAVFADEISAVARALGKHTIVVGHSFGGTMTRITGYRHGQDLGAVVLVDSVLPAQQGERQPPPMPKAHIRHYPSRAEAMRRFRLRPPQPCANGYLLEHIARHSVVEGDQGFRFKLDQALFAKLVPSRVPLPDAASMLPLIRCPVGFIYGEQSRFFPAPERARLATLLPADKLLAVANAHHHVFLDQPLGFIDALQGLLPRLA